MFAFGTTFGASAVRLVASASLSGVDSVACSWVFSVFPSADGSLKISHVNFVCNLFITF